MEEIIKQIWEKAEKEGWEALKDKKEHYLELSKLFELALIDSVKCDEKLKQIECTCENVVVKATEEEKQVLFECLECGKAYYERQHLYDHWKICHKTKLSL